MVESLVVGAVGSLRFRVTVRAAGGHSWSDRGAPSAVHALVRMLAAALDVVPTEREDVAFNVGTIEGGTTVNAIAAEASAVLDLRCGDDDDLQAIAGQLRGVLRADGVEVEVEQLGHRPGGALAAGHPLASCARRARERAGLPPAIEVASSTDANAAHGAGVPAITVGLSTGGNVHRLDEYLDLPPVAAGLAALAALADEVDATPF
jgi:acetylornithine deacetylase/succinyl-diaminopimelate desuccinylase-like protein